MNKQELIDKAVEERKGKWLGDEYNRICSLPDGKYCFVMTNFKSSLDDDVVCTKDEFTQRARELGWVNGYKYGVEYPTNGKKPDLPDDAVIIYNTGLKEYEPCKAEEYNWNNAVAFRICDERYKPIEVEQVQADWYDYDKQQAIGLPPVGAECERLKHNGNNEWDLVEVLYLGNERGMVRLIESNYEQDITYKYNKFRPIDYNRKADEEKRKFVEAAIAIADKIPPLQRRIEDIFKSMYAEGCRFK